MKSPVPRSEPLAEQLLEQLAEVETSSLTPSLARAILQWNFEDADRARVEWLSQRAQDGSLSDEERAELEEAIRTADLLAILKSKARRRLRRPSGNS